MQNPTLPGARGEFAVKLIKSMLQGLSPAWAFPKTLGLALAMP